MAVNHWPYKWKGFGFERNAESESFTDIKDLKKGRWIEGQDMKLKHWLRGKGVKWETFVFEDGKLKGKA